MNIKIYPKMCVYVSCMELYQSGVLCVDKMWKDDLLSKQLYVTIVTHVRHVAFLKGVGDRGKQNKEMKAQIYQKMEKKFLKTKKIGITRYMDLTIYKVHTCTCMYTSHICTIQRARPLRILNLTFSSPRLNLVLHTS